jgi:hypothetical protein
MKASLWGAHLMALPSTSRCLGAYVFETSPRSACLEWLYQTLCSYARYLGVSTLQTFKTKGFLASSSIKPKHCNYIYDIIGDSFSQGTFQFPAGYPRILGIVDLKPLSGRHAYKASSRSALPDSLQPCWEIWVSLHFVRSRP